MGFLSKTFDRYRPLYIRDGVLIKCNVKEENVEIPDKVEAVFEDAFKGCENVKLDRSPKYILDRLSNVIYSEMNSSEREHEEKAFSKSNKWSEQIKNRRPKFHLLKLWGVDSQIIEDAISTAREKIKVNEFGIEWKLKVMDANDIPSMSKEMDNIKRENLISVNEDGSVSTFENMPFIKHSAVQIGGVDSYKEDNKFLIEKEGYGILFIKNLNKENMEGLPHNFIYNLVKYHLFDRVGLSPKWLVILQVGEGVSLDAPSEFGMSYDFNRGGFKNISIEEYLKDVECHDRLVTQNMLWDAYFKLKQDKEKEQTK